MKLSNIILQEDKQDIFLKKLADEFSAKFPELKFNLAFPGTRHRRINVRGSQQNLSNFGNKYHGKKYGDYEVFHTDDDDQGEIVRFVKS